MPVPPLVVTVREIVVVALSEPEVRVMVTGDVPAVAVALAVNVSTLVEVAGLVPNAAVTPLGKPLAARVTEPLNGLTSVTVMVSVPLAPCATDRAVADGLSVKLPVAAAVTVRATVVVAVSEPEVPVMVIVLVAAAAVLATVSVSTLVEVAGLVPNAAVTPVGRPEAARVTEPANGLTSVTEMVSVPLLLWATERVVAEGFREKLPEPPPPPPQATPLTAKLLGTALVVPFQVPLKPMPVTLPPAATLPL